MVFFFCDLRVLARKLASSFGHPMQVSTQVQLAFTCDYLPVRLTRPLIGLLIFVTKKTTCSHGCGFHIESFTVQHCVLITLPVLWLVFVIFLSRVLGCIIFEKICISKRRTCIEILVRNGSYVKSA